jgi:engulfment and cell motility protein 1
MHMRIYADALHYSSFRRLVNSSVIEAADIIEKLSLRDDKNLKFALFSLQKFIKVSSTIREA